MMAILVWGACMQIISEKAQRKKVHAGLLEALVNSGIFDDIFEIRETKVITQESRNIARHAFGLPPLATPSERETPAHPLL